MKYIFTLYILITTNICFSQNDSTIRNIDFNYSIRGKLLAGPIAPEERMAATWTLGNEFILNRHSLGIDYTFFGKSIQTDNANDVALYTDYSKRRYLLFDYKFKLSENDWGNLYMNFYYKNGKYNSWTEADNLDSMTNAYIINSYEKGKFQEPGIGIGLKKYYGNFGIDISANYGYTIDNIDIVNAISATETIYLYDQTRTRHRLYIRLNLFFEFWKTK